MTDLKPKTSTGPGATDGPDVKHMKWWGWGVEGTAFHHDDKPAFAPFVKKMVGVDLHGESKAVAPSFDDLEIPVSRLTADVSGALSLIVGEDHVVIGDMDRVVHTYGKSIRDLIRMRNGDFPRTPDAVVYPATESEVAKIVATAVTHDLVLIPFGGGSNIVGSLEPMPAEERIVVSLDMGRLDRVLDIDRVVHTYGKSIRDLIRMRNGDFPRTPDAVVYPATESEVAKIVAAAVTHDLVLIPFGGGSNIVGSLEPMPAEERIVVSLDMGRLDRVLDIDEGAGLARIQAGAQGPDIEDQLNAKGWTLGHFPDSFTHSTLGGWVATRSSGMQSDKFGDIADITKGLRMVRPDGVVVIRAVPSASTGPSLREMIIGSEGRLGVITEVTAQVHRIPEKREILAYLFPTWEAGLKAMQAIAESDATPSVTRVSNEFETEMSFATSKESKGVSALVMQGLQRFLKVKGWNTEKMCLSFIGYEGSSEHVDRNEKLVSKIVKKYGGLGVGKGPGVLYDQKKFDTPYLRDFFLDHGGAADVSETSAPWSKLLPLYNGVYAAAQRAFDKVGVQGLLMAHLSHSYHSGACLYFTFAFEHDDKPLEQYDIVKKAIQDAFLAEGGTVSHHHGVGLEHAPWLGEDVSMPGLALMQGLFDSADPAHTFNPGKVTGK